MENTNVNAGFSWKTWSDEVQRQKGRDIQSTRER